MFGLGTLGRLDILRQHDLGNGFDGGEGRFEVSWPIPFRDQQGGPLQFVFGIPNADIGPCSCRYRATAGAFL